MRWSASVLRSAWERFGLPRELCSLGLRADRFKADRLQGVCTHSSASGLRRAFSWASPLVLLLSFTLGGPTAVGFAADRAEAGYVRTATFLKSGRLVVQPGKELRKASLLIRDGRIAAIGSDLQAPADAEVIDCSGLVIYPGLINAASASLIDADSKPTLPEARPVDVSRTVLTSLRPDDHNNITPQWRASSALKLPTDLLDRMREQGFTTVHVTPVGRIASGQSALVQLSGLPLREILLKDRGFITLRLFDPLSSIYPATLMGAHAHLRQHFLDAERWALQQRLYAERASQIERPVADPVWQALTELRTGQQRALFEASSRDDLERALRFAGEFGLQPVIWGGEAAAEWIEPLRRNQTALVLRLDFGEEPKLEPSKGTDDIPDAPVPAAVRQDRWNAWRQRVETPGKLERAGLKFGFSTHNLKSQADVWKAIRQARTAGLSADGALKALTTDAASILGIEQVTGRLEVGLLANVSVWTGPMDHDQAQVRYTFVEGRLFEYNRTAKPVKAKGAAEATLSLAGIWDLTIEGAAVPLPGTLELQQTGTRLTGRFTSGQGDGTVQNSKVTADAASWEVAIGAGDRAVILKFDAKKTKTGLKGTLQSPFGPAATWTARRQKAATTAAATASQAAVSGVAAAEKPAATGVAAPAQSTVQLESIETDDSKPAANDSPSAARSTTTATSATTSSRDDYPVSALSVTPKAPGPAAIEWPTETDAQRTRRWYRTGGNLFIRKVTVLTGTGATLVDHDVLIRGGQFAAIGPNLKPEPGMTVIDGSGRFLMPGIIDTHSHIMIAGGGVNEATNSITCEVRIGDSLSTSDVREYRALAGGVTTIRMLHGSANTIGGQDTIVQLRHGASIADHLMPDVPSGVKFALGENVKFRSGRFPNTRLGVEAVLLRSFVEAFEYRRQWQDYDRRKAADPQAAEAVLPPRKDLRLETLAAILSADKFIHCHSYRADEILMLLRVADQFGIKIRSLQHVLEGYKVAPEIAAHGASCSTFADWWAYKVEAYDAVPHNAAVLEEAGVNVVLKSDDAELMRHMYHEAQKPIRYGNFPIDRALALVTRNAARELGIDDRVGTIEVGKQADAALFNAHPLNTFARCELTMIAGEPWFVREKQPTAMSAAAVERSAKPAPLALPATDQRQPWIDWSAIRGNEFAITEARIVPVDGPAIERGTIHVKDGQIVAVGATVAVPEGCPVVRAAGLSVYPGLIDAGTTIGLTEIGKVTETHDYAETGSFQPDLRAGVAVNPDSELIPVARAGGITTALIRPTGGIICGQASVIQTAGWTAPEMVLLEAAGLQINWPGLKDRKEAVTELRTWLDEARRYHKARSSRPEAGGLERLLDPRYEALRPYLQGEKPIFVQAETLQHMLEVLQFAEREKLKIILCGAGDAWKIAPTLKSKNIPVILGPVMRKPVEDSDPFDAPYAAAGRLYEAGVAFCIRSDNAANCRNAPFEAGMAVAYGLPEAIGLRSVTLSSAEILGIAERTGSITPGKRADLVLLDGSPLQITSQVKGVVVGGRPMTPTSRQTTLWQKYRARLAQ